MADLPKSPLDRFMALVGYRLVEWSDGAATVEMTVSADHVNRSQVMHGGIYSVLIDTVCGYSGSFCHVPGNERRALTLHLSTQFLGAAAAGARITAKGRLVGGGRSIFFAEADIRDQAGNLLAVGNGTYKFRRGSENPEGVPIDRSRD